MYDERRCLWEEAAVPYGQERLPAPAGARGTESLPPVTARPPRSQPPSPLQPFLSLAQTQNPRAWGCWETSDPSTVLKHRPPLQSVHCLTSGFSLSWLFCASLPTDLGATERGCALEVVVRFTALAKMEGEGTDEQ